MPDPISTLSASPQPSKQKASATTADASAWQVALAQVQDVAAPEPMPGASGAIPAKPGARPPAKPANGLALPLTAKLPKILQSHERQPASAGMASGLHATPQRQAHDLAGLVAPPLAAIMQAPSAIAPAHPAAPASVAPARAAAASLAPARLQEAAAATGAAKGASLTPPGVAAANPQLPQPATLHGAAQAANPAPLPPPGAALASALPSLVQPSLVQPGQALPSPALPSPAPPGPAVTAQPARLGTAAASLAAADARLKTPSHGAVASLEVAGAVPPKAATSPPLLNAALAPPAASALLAAAHFNATAGAHASASVGSPVGAPLTMPHGASAATQPSAAGLAAAVTAMHQAQQSGTVLRLDPPGLGHLAVHVALSPAGQVNVLFVPSTADAASALQASLPGLAPALAQSGLTLGQAQVGGQLPQGAGQNAGRGAEQGGQPPRFAAPLAGLPDPAPQGGLSAYA